MITCCPCHYYITFETIISSLVLLLSNYFWNRRDNGYLCSFRKICVILILLIYLLRIPNELHSRRYCKISFFLYGTTWWSMHLKVIVPLASTCICDNVLSINETSDTDSSGRITALHMFTDKNYNMLLYISFFAVLL